MDTNFMKETLALPVYSLLSRYFNVPADEP
jgi:hypothetical protein